MLIKGTISEELAVVLASIIANAGNVRNKKPG
jgi:hypothetical protein